MNFLSKSVACLILGLSAILTAGNINLADINSQALWFAHFDIEKFNDSYLRKLADENGLADKCEKVNKFLDIDPTESINSVTLYCVSGNPEQAAVIMKGSFDVDKLSKIASKQPEYTETIYNKITIASWKSFRNTTKSGCFYDANTLIMSKSKDSIKNAIDTISGTSPSLSGSNCITSDNSIFQLFLTDASTLSKQDPHLVVLNNVGKSLFSVGQKDDDMFCELIVQADTDENTKLLNQMIQGMIAMGKMNAKDKNSQLMLNALDKMSVSTLDKNVITTAVLSTGEFDSLIKKIISDRMLSKIYEQIPEKGHI
ncbi:MAG: hypothetical protein ACIAQZ_14335 [Sedimentisphaeraceae bacterium JB056]